MIAGVGDDKVNVGVTAPDFGDDVVIGDNGHVDFDTTTGESVMTSSKPLLLSTVATI